MTPLPQPGNPKPRLFRLDADQGVINRLGLNSEGAEAVAARLAARAAKGHRRRQHWRQQGDARPHRGLCRLHRGARRACEFSHRQHLVAQYARPAQPAAGRRARRTACPRDRCARARRGRNRAQAGAASRSRRIFRLAISTTWSVLRAVIASTAWSSATPRSPGRTCAKPKRRKRPAGSPADRCLRSSTRILAESYVRAEGAFPLIGAGGIDSGAAAFAKIKAGASLVQLLLRADLSRRRAGRVDQEGLAGFSAHRADGRARRCRRARRRRSHGAAVAGLNVAFTSVG